MRHSKKSLENLKNGVRFTSQNAKEFGKRGQLESVKARMRNKRVAAATMKIADMSITDEELKKELAELLALVNALFAVLVILGIVADPTTEGLHDSQRALSYERPFSDAKNAD